ncbi:MAG: hypothetical protein HY547_06845 [Elusimicrobia bacterium]|nr:hypothetical protein [Elusimicrobiota bacterium]
MTIKYLLVILAGLAVTPSVSLALTADVRDRNIFIKKGVISGKVTTIDIGRDNSWDAPPSVLIKVESKSDLKQVLLLFSQNPDGFKFTIDLLSFLTHGQTIILPDKADAAKLLSRFAAGSMLPSKPVSNAITTLATEGTDEDIPVLRSLVDFENGEIQEAAGRAIAEIEGRQGASGLKTAYKDREICQVIIAHPNNGPKLSVCDREFSQGLSSDDDGDDDEIDQKDHRP